MHGIVTLLDNEHYQLVEDLWTELKREFSVDGVYVTPYPHFSYHAAQDYDVDKIESVLERIASNITTFKVRTSGLAIFTGASPVLYIKAFLCWLNEIDSTEIIRQQREERTRQLLGEDE
jgi:hypothetical protein